MVGSAAKLKWAASQEAVTFPWLSAHSIRKGIGGDTYIVNLAERLSSANCRSNLPRPKAIPRRIFQSHKFPAQDPLSIDTILARVLVLLVL